MKKLWTDRAWEDYLYWQEEDKNTLKKVNKLIKDNNLEISQCKGHYDE